MRRRPARRARSSRDNVLLLIAGALVAIVVVSAVVSWLARHLVVVVLLIVVGAVVAAVLHRRRAAASRRLFQARAAQSRHIGGYLAMTPKQFEHALAFLCERDGCTRVRVVGGAGDLAADVLAVAPTGRRILIQAKRYGPRTMVTSADVQKVNGTYRDVHGCDLAAVVTTSGFTRAAADFCRLVGIRAYDRRSLARWAEGTGAPPWV
ncbi:restriction endonuclease [Kitasatospora cinereorecta]|uniref:Restriction endonuclease n=1 Tax=Kitasatospora cinereorecta TaxID=285560 RepID=A0ABW0VPQ7_9ACTN